MVIRQAPSLYNRQALATGILLISNNQSSLVNEEEIWKYYNLTKFDADATPYDLLTRNGGPIEADYSKGTLIVKIHRMLGDDELEQICKSAGIEQL